jgi:hypothetical protein
MRQSKTGSADEAMLGTCMVILVGTNEAADQPTTRLVHRVTKKTALTHIENVQASHAPQAVAAKQIIFDPHACVGWLRHVASRSRSHQ